ncbi:MAG TPA: TlpA disulfide reductase family protein [Blastocatellia bacterium]|nr:TlpA disulfide reductase family protein [Blastocatellia bacterium]
MNSKQAPVWHSNNSRSKYVALSVLILLIGVVLVTPGCRRRPRELNGIWYGMVVNKNGDELPIKMELKREGNNVIGSFINGDERITSTSGSFDASTETLKLRFDYYDGDLEGRFFRRELIGTFTRQWRREKLVRDLKLWRGAPMVVPAAAEGKDLSGEWSVKVGEGEQQKVWRMSLKQNGAEVTGTIIPPSGDWGSLTGTFGYGKLTMSRFDGINARLLRAELNEQGQLVGVVDLGLADPKRKIVAERVTGEAATKADTLATRMKNPTEPFKFSLPDLDGKTVSSTDERFKDKVVIITTTGSWCPNCYDEAPFLNELYDKYHSSGLEIVALGFEYTGDAARDTKQLKTFAERHNTKYPILYAGSTDDAAQRLAQLENFGAYPTTIFIGRDGLMKRIHAGFDGPATGERFTRLKAEMEEIVKELLKEAE